MCWQCDHPAASQADYLDQIRELMARFGWAVQGVSRDRLHPPWAYTVGLTRLGLPELAITGMPLRRATRLLNEVAAHALHADPPQPGEQVQLTDGPLIEFVHVSQPSVHLNIAEAIFGPVIRAIQVVHADDRGHWPWDVGYRGVQGGQPVLGVRGTRPATAA